MITISYASESLQTLDGPNTSKAWRVRLHFAAAVIYVRSISGS